MRNVAYPTITERANDGALGMIFVGTDVVETNANFNETFTYPRGRIDLSPELHEGITLGVIDQEIQMPFANNDKQIERLLVNGFVGVVRLTRLYRPR